MLKKLILRYFRNDLDYLPDKDSLSLGRKGETIACRHLKKNGYKVLEKNFRSRFGELDIIANESENIVFVEVKSRTSTEYGLPQKFVTKDKQKKIIKSAMIYLSQNDLHNENVRFDVVSINLGDESCEVIKGAYEVED